MKQTKASKTKLKQPQNETRLSSKPTQKTKEIKQVYSTRGKDTYKYKAT
jgi:hypothetical protein